MFENCTVCKERNYQKYIPAVIRFSADIRNLNLIVLQPDRFILGDNNSMLSLLNHGDVSCNKMAWDILKNIPERSGLMDLDIYGNSILYASKPISKRIDKDRISIFHKDREQFYKLIVIQE